MKALAAGSVVIWIVALMSPAFAEDRGKAKLHHQQAMRRVMEKKYREAIAEFQAAYDAAPRPVFLYNIARAHQDLGESGDLSDLRSAVTFYRKYLAVGKDVPNRAEVESALTTLRSRIDAREALNQRSNDPAPVVVPLVTPSVGDALAPASIRPESVSVAGPAETAGLNAAHGRAPVPTAADRSSAAPQAFAIGQALATSLAEPVAPSSQAASRVGRMMQIGGGVMLGAGTLAALGLSLGFGVEAHRQARAIETQANQKQAFDPTLEESYRESRVVAVVGGVGGGVVALVGAVLLGTGPRKAGGAPKAGRAWIAPWSQRHSSGVVAGGVF